MSENFHDENAYLKEHCLSIYFEDSIRSLLESRRRSPLTTNGKFDINAHLRDYFSQIKRESHVLGREFSFISATPHNRRSFLTHIWSKCETATAAPATIKEMHSLILSICSDFPYCLLEQSQNMIEENDSTNGFDYVTFLRAFQVRFLYEEFLDESQHLFRSFSHRLTCHVPTAESNFTQSDNNHRQMLIESFEKIIATKVSTSPPFSVVEEILQSIDQQITYQRFVCQLSKNEKLSRLIGKEPTVSKQTRPIQQQRSVIEPIPCIQNETKITLASLSTPTTRISSPIGPSAVLPPIPKQQNLIREKPIRQDSATMNNSNSSNLPKRPESAGSFLAKPTSAKSSSQIATIIKQEISETDSDVESRSSDTDT